ncbi:MAG: hypothetical protein HUJ13_10685, partial [Hydrogenovibrio crunogenus]|nr:hypothetical protein [Hydrogenovibrio crunogenus]
GLGYVYKRPLYDSFKQDDAILISQDENELAQQLIQLADSTEWRNQKAEEAYACFEKQSGALPKLMHEIGQLLPPTE